MKGKRGRKPKKLYATETPKKHRRHNISENNYTNSPDGKSPNSYLGRKTTYSNKQRQLSSLDGLTKKFIQCVKEKGEENIDINEIVKSLKVKKRRIYDITNVLEGIGYIKKSAKNQLQWLHKDTFKEPLNYSFNTLSEQQNHQNLKREILFVKNLTEKTIQENLKIMNEQKNNNTDFLIYEDFHKILSKNTMVACVRSEGPIEIEEDHKKGSDDIKIKQFREDNKKLGYGYSDDNILLTCYPNRLYFTSPEGKEVEVYVIANEPVENYDNEQHIVEKISREEYVDDEEDRFLSHNFNEYGMIDRKESLP